MDHGNTRAQGSAAATATLRSFREGFHRALTGWADAAFELTDALLCQPTTVTSVPALSLQPVFRRSHGSLYKALARGQVDPERMRDLLVAHRPAQWPAVFAVDASTWERRDAQTSPERGFYYSPSKHSAGKPVVAGWSYQWITQLDWAPDSWTAPMDAVRIQPTRDTTTATIEQVTHLVNRLPHHDQVPMFVFDAGYNPITISAGLADVRAQVLVRIRGNRVFHTDPPPRAPGTRGRPRLHGTRFALSDPATAPAPTAELSIQDNRHGAVHVSAWTGLHPKVEHARSPANHDTPPIVRGTVIRVDIDHLARPSPAPLKTLWLWWSGPDQPDLDLCWRAYLRRFDIEHTFRFAKTTLGWTTPALRTPEQADRWTWLVIAAHTQLRLARSLVADIRLPWERPAHLDKLTPGRVRRAFHRLRATLDTPANPPKSDVAGPGRPKDTRRPPRTRHPAIRKAA